MNLHVLPGDAYVDAFRQIDLDGDVAIFREALVDGDLRGESLSDFWQTRESYHSDVEEPEQPPYKSYVASEVEKLLIPAIDDEIYLWFEYELFCSVNYWFCLHLLKDSSATIYRVSPAIRTQETRWRGFGSLGPEELRHCWNDRVRLTAEDVAHGSDLWQAFKNGNAVRLTELGIYESNAFPYLGEVVIAATEVETRPKKVLAEITSEGKTELADAFPEFVRRAGVFGFGDLQVKRLMDESIGST